MKNLNPDEFVSLTDHRGEPCVTLLMPTHKAGPDTRQDPIQFKNLLRDAHDKLVRRGMRSGDAADLLAPATALIDEAPFWQHQRMGMAMFIAPERQGYVMLDQPVEPRVLVDDHFHGELVAPMVLTQERYHVLALSLSAARFFEGNRRELRPIDVPGMPTSIQDFLRYDDPERQLQFHTQTGERRPGGERAAVYHGQGVGTDDAVEKKNILEYCRLVDAALRPILARSRQPLIFAGDRPLLAMYQQANSYPYLREQGVWGNPDRLSPQELFQAVRVLVESAAFRAA